MKWKIPSKTNKDSLIGFVRKICEWIKYFREAELGLPAFPSTESAWLSDKISLKVCLVLERRRRNENKKIK